MKKIYFASAIIFTLTIKAQTIVTSNVTWPLGMELSGNTMFVAENSIDRISKLDLSQTNPIPEPYITGLYRPDYMYLDGTILYFTEFYGNKISKVDIMQQSPTVTVILSDLNNPKGIFLHGDFLYYSEMNKISKIDITQPNPIPIVLVNNLTGPISIVRHENYLFYSQFFLGRISKIDFTDSNPVPIIVKNGLLGVNGDMAVRNNILYFAEQDISTISTLDLTQIDPPLTTFDTGIKASGFYFHQDKLYVSDFMANKIYEYSVPLSVQQNEKNKIGFYPNPVRRSALVLLGKNVCSNQENFIIAERTLLLFPFLRKCA
ncbi:hypothetical protein [Flavobacterium sp.]|uniref:hypothetical protein n=1 Tax=Flavobacterium sp. TaxID=239 RepID=UPI0039E5BA45